jgi:hypothetical protein
MKLQTSVIGMTFVHGSSLISDRQKLVKLTGSHSTIVTSTYVIPKGFILGPLLCLVYVNDMSATLSNKLLLYADDSGIHVSGKMNLKKNLFYGMSLIID